MKKQYIRQVRKDLHIPRSAKAEVVRDLQEIFASAAEHGESEQQVAERLGRRGNLPTGLRSSSASIPPRAGGETG